MDRSILYLVDPESFASLILVDHSWRQAAQTPHLYAHHLSRCPSFSLNHNVVDAGPFTDESLPRLKRKFAQEVKRNLFEAYLQPRRTVISLVSTTTSSSAAFPGGEAFDFVFSSNGHWTLALSSSRIYVIDTSSSNVTVSRELKVLRRPVSAAILDNGSLLAVLSSNQHVYVYSVTSAEVKHMRSISLENKAHALTLAPKGDVLAAAYDSGVEIYSLVSGSADTERRTIKCERADALTFSHDSSILMGTTRHSENPNTVILTAPYMTDETLELPPADRISYMWTNQIVFPKSTRDCSHATLLPNRLDGDGNWIFTYDRVFESFRAVRTDDLRNGTTYFTGPRRASRESSRPSRRKLTPCTLPAASQNGELVAAGFSGKDVWLYGVPEGLDVSAVSQTDETNSQSGSSAGPSTPVSGPGNSVKSMAKGETSELTKLPKWQVLVDKYRNVFAKGRRVAEVPGVSAISWVSRVEEKAEPCSLRERLVIGAPGGISADPQLEQDDFAAVDGGRLVILDFDRTPCDGEIESLVLEVGHAVPEILREETVDLETEVALARRRTVKQGNVDRRTVVGVLASRDDMFAPPPIGNSVHHVPVSNAPSLESPSNHSPGLRETSSTATTSSDDGMTLQEATHIFEGPYSHTQPRSRDSIYRSATAVAANRERNPPRIISESRLEYRRAGGRGELPHESDADNWVPPPPPYAPKADIPLPEHLQRTLLPKQAPSISRPPVGRQKLRRASTAFESPTHRISRRISSLPEHQSESSRSPSHPYMARALSGSVPQITRPVSPLSSSSPDVLDDRSEVSNLSHVPAAASSSRRQVSGYVGRLTGSLRRPHSSRYSAADATPPVPPIPREHASEPSTPVNANYPIPVARPFQLPPTSGRLRDERPLPPTPSNQTGEVHSPQSSIPSPISLPSAEQLSNLNDRVRKPPPRHAIMAAARNKSDDSGLSPGSIVPAPPRGALGAAGNAGPSHVSTKAQSPSQASSLFSKRDSRNLRSLSTLHNVSARSSPALLRPTPKRLDTIDSVSSLISRTTTRSRSRDLTLSGSRVLAGDETGGSATPTGVPREPVMHIPSDEADLRERPVSKRRSQSAGPALKLDRVHMGAGGNDDRTRRKGFLGGGKKPRRGRDRSSNGEEDLDVSEDKGGKCLVM